MSEDISQLIADAISASVLAGVEILEVYAGSVEVATKEDRSPLTEADLRSNKVIVEYLGAKSDLPILSEETKLVPFDQRKNWQRFWLVDPLDGTKEFINRTDEFTVNIALIEGKRPIAGVIYVPVERKLYFATESRGAFCLDLAERDGKVDDLGSLDAIEARAEKLSGEATPNRPYTIIGTRSHANEQYVAYVDDLKAKHPGAELISAGSSLKFCRIAEGLADIYPRLGPTSEWDTAAGHAIVSAIGKKVVQFEAQEHDLEYNKADILNPYFLVV